MSRSFRILTTASVGVFIASASVLAQPVRTRLSIRNNENLLQSRGQNFFQLTLDAAMRSEPCFGPRETGATHHARGFFGVETEDIREINLDGLKKLIQRDAKDTRPLLVNFWATWCDPCREEFPDLVKLDNDYRSKGLSFVAVSLDDLSDIKSAVPKFLDEMKATMPVVLLNVNDPEPAIKAIDATWDGQLPATFLYDNQGKTVFKHFGRIQPIELRAAIDKELNRKQ